MKKYRINWEQMHNGVLYGLIVIGLLVSGVFTWMSLVFLSTFGR